MNIRSVLLRDSGKLAQTGKTPDHFTQMIRQVYASNRTLETDRLTLQQLYNRKTTLTRAMRSQHPTSVSIPVVGEKTCRIMDDFDLPTHDES